MVTRQRLNKMQIMFRCKVYCLFNSGLLCALKYAVLFCFSNRVISENSSKVTVDYQ